MLNALKRLVRPGPRPRRWINRPEDLPWFDRPDAAARLAALRGSGEVSETDAALLEHWIRDGYCVVEGAVREDLIDSMLASLESLWTASAPVPGLEILGARFNESEPLARSHEAILAMPEEERIRRRDQTPWRIHNFFEHCPAAREIHDNAELKRIVALLYGREGRPEATINFMYGSRQALHQDMAVFHIHPMNHLIGAWLACEDVRPGCGPLVYYPGSHREPMFPAFGNYPQTSLKTCSKAESAAYEDYLRRTSERYERREFLGRKGQVLLWHGMLIHGGAPIETPDLTRKSYVCHYIPPGMDRGKEVVGPFNW